MLVLANTAFSGLGNRNAYTMCVLAGAWALIGIGRLLLNDALFTKEAALIGRGALNRIITVSKEELSLKRNLKLIVQRRRNL